MQLLSSQEIDFFHKNGVVCLRKRLRDKWLDLLRNGFNRNLRSPSPLAGFYATQEIEGRFQDDYCNWQKIPEFRTVIFDSELAQMAALLLNAKAIRFFYEHIFFKKRGTVKKTPWHQDLPYFCVDGDQGLSFWIPLSPVDESNKIEFIAGSHAWGKLFPPQKFNGIDSYNIPIEIYDEPPEFDSPKENYNKLSWEMDVGDILAFDFRTIHGNTESKCPSLFDRRAIAFRFLGENMRYTKRPGEKSPPFTEVTLDAGAELNHPSFPLVWKKP